MNRPTATVLAAVGLAGCASVSVSSVPLITTFNPAEVAYINDRGTNAIEGSALIRQRGGGIVTCAGNKVTLIPSAAYAQERARIFYGTASHKAFRRMYGGSIPSSTQEEDAAYLRYTKSTHCDTEGRFKFQDVAQGSYFVVTTVTWTESTIMATKAGI